MTTLAHMLIFNWSKLQRFETLEIWHAVLNKKFSLIFQKNRIL